MPSLTRTLAAAGALVVAGTFAPTSAEAATGYARCPVNRMCVFSGTNGTGAIGIFTTGDHNLGDMTGPRGLNNTIESVWNRRNEYWGLWNNAGYTGGITEVTPRAKGNIAAKYRNLTTSLKTIRG